MSRGSVGAESWENIAWVCNSSFFYMYQLQTNIASCFVNSATISRYENVLEFIEPKLKLFIYDQLHLEFT